MVFFLLGCDSKSLEIFSFKLGLKMAMKDGCEKDEDCLSLIKKNFKVCVDDLDYKDVLKAVKQNNEIKLFEYVWGVDNCVFNE